MFFSPHSQSVSCLFSVFVKYLFYIPAMNTFRWQANIVGNVIGSEEGKFLVFFWFYGMQMCGYKTF